ncbi:hypothetical protein ACFFRR_004843 [Megaselia abdita]
MSFRTIVLFFALILCMTQVSLARPAEESTSLLAENNLVQHLEAGMEQFHKLVDDVQNNPAVVEVNKLGTELIFGTYQAVMKFAQLAFANHLQDGDAPAADAE